MKLTDEQVLHVARLARLALSRDEVQRMREQLSAILDAVDVLSQVQTETIGSTPSRGAGLQDLREDVVQGELGTRAALSNAPQVAATSFVIPKVLE